MHELSSLVKTFVNYKPKKIFNIRTWAQCQKTFFIRNLHFFVKGVCPWQVFHSYSHKHYSLVQIFVNYGQKGVITLAPGASYCQVFIVLKAVFTCVRSDCLSVCLPACLSVFL